MMVIADTSFVVAVAVRTDDHHDECVRVFRQFNQIYLPQSTLAEIAFMLNRTAGKEGVEYFFAHLPDSKYEAVALQDEDFIRTAAILRKYADTRIDFVDASIAAVAERLKIVRILTLDQRDFQILQPVHAGHFDVLP